ncbi:alginate O-acetyltransferase AlgX-related protein [Clostridium aminobutyricum]|uniref:AlgX/AlgJ SGNH hydrolase-like domain-containing protein n=1 Tax=Clostridium aminobutyricum TaxID=33953 RepID=A0A939D789_CLOAM|nr:hypothetical protein [Clostridium aminobutyricum]MBN7772387.1 hypothetical protein [Clostridium aminobutyricum]
MKIKVEGITAILFFAIIFGMFIGLLADKDKSPVHEFLVEYRTEVLPGTPIFDRLSSAIQIAEDVIYENTYQKEAYNDLYGFVQKMLGKRIISDAGYGEIYRTTYDQIIFKVEKKEKEVEQSLRSITELKHELDEIGIPLLYVQAPFKLTDSEQQIPINKKDYVDANVNLFLKGLDENNIDYLDLRPLLRNGTKTQKELFFDTDHHWRIETAFDATGYIEDELNKDYGFHIDSKYKDIKNYNTKTFKNCYLGSMGRRTGQLYSGLDDFTLITPKFKTDYTLYQYDYGAETVFNGSFKNAVLVKEYMQEKAPVDNNRYAVYHGDNTELIFQNHLVNDGRVLMIKDSFGIPVYSFLSLGVSEVRALDLRLFKDSIVEYAKKNKPDVVVILYNGDSFNKEMFTFS